MNKSITLQKQISFYIDFQIKYQGALTFFSIKVFFHGH